MRSVAFFLRVKEKKKFGLMIRLPFVYHYSSTVKHNFFVIGLFVCYRLALQTGQRDLQAKHSTVTMEGLRLLVVRGDIGPCIDSICFSGPNDSVRFAINGHFR